MANNYTPSYNQYRTQTAGYALPSSVRTYSVFDPASNTWRRMTNDGMSPMPQGNQADIQAALAQARQTQGTVYPAQGMGQGQPVEMHPGYLNPPVQTPAQMPSGGSRTPSQPLSRGGTVVVQGQPANESVAEAMSLRGPSIDASGVSLNPNLNYPFRSNFENFQQEIPRSNAYGPLQNPRTVRNMSPDYQEASAAPVQTATPTAAPAQTTRAVGYPTTDIFGDEMYWRTKANRLGDDYAIKNEITRGINQTIDAALHTPALAPIGYLNAVLRGITVPRGLAALQLAPTAEPLARISRLGTTAGSATRATATGTKLSPQAQKIADSLKFTFNH